MKRLLHWRYGGLHAESGAAERRIQARNDRSAQHTRTGQGVLLLLFLIWDFCVRQCGSRYGVDSSSITCEAAVRVVFGQSVVGQAGSQVDEVEK